MRFSISQIAVSMVALGLGLRGAGAVNIDFNSDESIKTAASSIAAGLVSFYKPHVIPGLIPNPPYYWWLGGAMFGELIEYWNYTGDATYNSMVTEGMLFQIGDHQDFEPENRTRELGNDDQAFWAFSALTAAELKFPEPPAGQPSWISLAQAVFNRQVTRWDNQYCGGGLRWQTVSLNVGYDYKNTISNGGFFQISARLARYTNNGTYAEWAEKAWDWLTQIGFVTSEYVVYDGASIDNQCKTVDPRRWTYNVGTLLSGAAYMYNHTKDEKWKTRIDGLLDNAFQTFYPDIYGSNILIEIQCEFTTCNIDQPSFKSYLVRWMALTAQLAPYTYERIMPKILASAKGAAGACSQPGQDANAVMCGRNWTTNAYDGQSGLGEQMSALAIVMANLVPKQSPPITEADGLSKGNAAAGTDDPNDTRIPVLRTITTADKAGAVIVTLLVIVATVGSGVWLVR